MAQSNMTLQKRSVQLLKPTSPTQPKPSLTNVAVCSGCHGCTNAGKSPTDPVVHPPTRMY